MGVLQRNPHYKGYRTPKSIIGYATASATYGFCGRTPKNVRSELAKQLLMNLPDFPLLSVPTSHLPASIILKRTILI
jgi:hypothetical protein